MCVCVCVCVRVESCVYMQSVFVSLRYQRMTQA